MNERESNRIAGEAWRTGTMRTITEVFLNACRQEPERPAIIVDNGLIVTRRELFEQCAHFADFLRDRVRPGDRVAVFLGNRIEFIVALIGIVANRATLVSIPPTVPEQFVSQILHDSAPVLAIADKQQAALLRQMRKNYPSLRELLVLDGPEPDGLSGFTDSATPRVLHEVTCRRDDIVALYYTSGNAGTPMGRMLDHGWWLRGLDVDQRLFQRGSQDRQLCCLPLYCTESVTQLLTSLRTRGSMIAMRNFSVSRFWDVVRNFDATEILSHASIPNLLLNGKPEPRERDHRVRIAFHEGVPKELHRELVGRFGFDWLDNYCNTECGLISRVPLHLAEDLIGSGSIGLEVPEVEIRIVDEAGHDVADGLIGEALVSGPDLFRGYLGHPDMTSEAIRDGWFYTGDLLRRDEGGLLYFMGRSQDIDRHGENSIAPSLTRDSR